MYNMCDNSKQKIQIYYKFSKLNQHLVNSVDNYRNYIYEGAVFSDVSCTKKIGLLTSEQIVNITNGEAKATYTLQLADGYLTFFLYNNTINGKALPNSTTIGPVICGTNKYLFWNSSAYFQKFTALGDSDTRSIGIYKKQI